MMEGLSSREIDLATWPRRAIFDGFRRCEYPYLVIGAEVEMGDAPRIWKEKGISPFLACVHSICTAANAVPAFRQRIRGPSGSPRVIEFDRIHADFTVAEGEDLFTIRKVPFFPSLPDFIRSLESPEGMAGTTNAPGVEVDLATEDEDDDHWVFMSCLPWVRFNHVVQPIRKLQHDSVPRVIWGRFSQDAGKSGWRVPVSVQVHHALVDGLHVARFLEGMEAAIRASCLPLQ